MLILMQSVIITGVRPGPQSQEGGHPGCCVRALPTAWLSRTPCAAGAPKDASISHLLRDLGATVPPRKCTFGPGG